LTLWLEPVLGVHESDTAKVPLAVIATIVALVGIVVSIMIYAKHRAKPIEPEVLAEGWYYDQTVSRFMGGPGRKAFGALAWADATIVDGAVNGVGRLVRDTAQRIRTVQSGNVRNYAAAIGVGVVLLLAWFVVVRGSR
jgi:NADH-quinone oxidoreductase subunit L